jgi:hypothetical protein
MKGGMRNSCKILVKQPGRKRPLGRHRHKWVNNIKMDVKEARRDAMGWIYVA